MNNIQKIRDNCFNHQAGRCYYCQQPMWRADSDIFALNYRISENKARHLKASAEHLIARSDGGADSAQNIVAACIYCNRHRHKGRVALTPARYLKKVRARLAAGKWHGLRLT